MFDHPMYFRRDGTPIWYGPGEEAAHRALYEWAHLMEHGDRHVADTYLPNGIRVSTVWLGLDHGWPWSARPEIFESMAFAAEVKVHKAREGGLFTRDFEYHEELDCERYHSEAEALVGHMNMCEKFFAGARLLSEVVND